MCDATRAAFVLLQLLCLSGGATAFVVLQRPNTSLATIPTAYFGGKGGKSGPRDDANIAMLAKARLIILEKWEGPCWDGCLANATAEPPLPCSPSCDVESHMLTTLRRVRALNPRVTTMLYLNTLLLFPFYSLAERYIEQGALLIDSQTGKPVELRNDDGMPGVLVPDFGQAAARALWMGEVEGWLATGLVDGIFADKWPDQAHANHTDNSSWLVCNHVCGTVTAEQGAAFNAGKMTLRQDVSDLFKVNDDSSFNGLLYGDGCDGCYRKSPRIDGNLVGPWLKNWQFVPTHERTTGQNVLNLMAQTRQMLHEYNYSYVYIGCGDHNPSEGKPFKHTCADDLCTDCTPQGIAIFLLLVEEGVCEFQPPPGLASSPAGRRAPMPPRCALQFVVQLMMPFVCVPVVLGTNGWDPAFEKSLGAPLGPAVNVTNNVGELVGLTREFASGTRVAFNLSNNSAVVEWAEYE